MIMIAMMRLQSDKYACQLIDDRQMALAALGEGILKRGNIWSYA